MSEILSDLEVFIYFFIYIFIGIVIIQYIDKEENGRLDNPALRDKIHVATKELYESIDNNLLLSFIDGIMYIIILFSLIVYMIKDANSILIKEFLPKLLFLFYFRILCIWITEIPSSMRHNKRSYLNPVTIDHMFSSHTMFFIAFIIYINIFFPLYATSIILVFIYTFMIILSREHYSIDVLISIAITTLIFSKYLMVGHLSK